MRENVTFRFNDHTQINGPKEYSVEIVIPGKYSNHIIAKNQTEMGKEIAKAMVGIMTMLEVPLETVYVDAEGKPTSEESLAPVFTTADGEVLPVGFGGTTKATFAAEIYRDGKLVE